MKLAPCQLPLAPIVSGVKSSKTSALTPILRSDSPSRTSVLRQKLQTALADAADRNSTGAPQFGQAARQARCDEVAIRRPPRQDVTRWPRTPSQLLQQL